MTTNQLCLSLVGLAVLSLFLMPPHGDVMPASFMKLELASWAMFFVVGRIYQKAMHP